MPDTGVNRSAEFAELKQLILLLREDQTDGRSETQSALAEIRRDMATKTEVQRYSEENNRRFTEVQERIGEVDKERVAGDAELHSRVNKVRDDLNTRIDETKRDLDAQAAEVRKTKSQRTFQIATIVVTAALGTISTIVSAIVVASVLGGGG
jgi:predicted nuclease with TOPRIM domain